MLCWCCLGSVAGCCRHVSVGAGIACPLNGLHTPMFTKMGGCLRGWVRPRTRFACAKSGAGAGSVQDVAACPFSLVRAPSLGVRARNARPYGMARERRHHPSRAR